MSLTNAAGGVHIDIHPTAKFRTDTISVSFLWPLRRQDTAASYLLSYLLADSCEKYRAKKAVIRQLDKLYGASLNIINEPFGCADRLRFSISGIDCPDGTSSQLEDLMDLLAEFIFHPRLENGTFAQSVFRECLDQAVIGIRECRDDPFFLCAELAARNYGGAVSRRILPEIDDLMRLTPANCLQFWNYVISHARIDIQVLADCDEETAAQMVREKFPFAPRNISVTVTDVIPGNDVEAVIEKDIPQSHIAMMFETGCHSGDPMMPALLMGNGIFGSLPVSLLFQKVREELGLCYSIDSRVMPFDGIIRVSAAGRKEAIEEIRREVCLQLERMQAGDFEEDLLEAARMMTIHSVRSAQDIPDALLMAYYRRALVPKTPNLNVLSDMYRRVTARDIQTCFQRLKLRTVAIVRQGDTYAEE